MKGFAELHKEDGNPMFIRPEEVLTINPAVDGGCYIVTKSGPQIFVTERAYEIAAKLESAQADS